MFFVPTMWIWRLDLSGYVLNCEISTPDKVWTHYARSWFNYDGDVTPTWRKKLSQISDRKHATVKYTSTVWKDSNCVCSVEKFLALFKHIPCSKLIPWLFHFFVVF